MKLLILDRDGVINEDRDDFVKSPDEWSPIPGSLEAIGELTRAGWIVVVATNQSGVGRGLFDVDTLNRIHAKMHRAAQEFGGHIDAVFFCPHKPDAGCDCRKPLPGMIHDIAKRFHADLQGTWMVGDSLRDLQAFAAAGGRPALVLTGNGSQTQEGGYLPEGTAVFDNLAQFTAFLLKRHH
ncbi:D-glycero-beta-D-manno-heptose 1,7-bisphosphate 7-phosphatase [Andreprevotia chitinilytica]|uniref:D-glycero-beta-D-manno-heptose 1,7-bisphosphate 7-phosphatase n=1 Tax=Andreprevotia chitinilytica TaxID=396808 RepID=UPI00054D52C0|nr:D-glycero-beta-D-manno-heptose 1,7-bisphosphate 7-phosphatase [Andreprevotia chitinilytica]